MGEWVTFFLTDALESIRFYFHPPVTRKRRRRCTQDESRLACFRWSFASDFFNFLLVRFHQVEIIIVKHFIQGHNNKGGS